MGSRFASYIFIFIIGFTTGIFFSSGLTQKFDTHSFEQALHPSYSPTPENVLGTTTTSTLHTITRVIDGDTVELDNKQKVRYIGIDTPEIHSPVKPVQCFGKEAAEKNKDLALGKQVKLVKDVSETDPYGRLLRYVFINNKNASDDGLFVNEYLVKEGYAHAATFPPDVKYSQHFIELEAQARQAGKGLWSACPQ